VSESKLYQVTLNSKQVEAISCACELFTRIRLGQFSDILWKVYPEKMLGEQRPEIDRLFDQLGMLLRGKLSHYGSDSDWSERSEITWDIYQVLRNRLAWDRNPSGNPMNVDFDDPMPKNRDVKLVKIQQVMEVQKDGTNLSISTKSDVPISEAGPSESWRYERLHDRKKR
jgi:hypothetical protein